MYGNDRVEMLTYCPIKLPQTHSLRYRRLTNCYGLQQQLLTYRYVTHLWFETKLTYRHVTRPRFSAQLAVELNADFCGDRHETLLSLQCLGQHHLTDH